MSDFKLIPTVRLRFIERPSSDPSRPSGASTKILQQWFAPDMPGYMRDAAKGEWRDVPLEPESG
jgi:hypothetical protein